MNAGIHEAPAPEDEPTVVDAPPDLAAIATDSLDAFHRALNEGDDEDYLAFLEPDVDFQTVTAAAEGIVYHGRDEVRDYIRRIREAFEETRVQPKQILLVGEDLIVVLGSWFARGLGSGVEIETEWGSIVQLRDERACWLRAYTSHEETLTVAKGRASGLI